ncbi:MAG: dTMP kinase [Betaproteobacteria bacterium]|jgi:dTMP kinase|nr:dTMP kinase [Betaproteobacteria bacterium]
MRGRFITVEGLDGAGKSTQLDLAGTFLRQRGIPLCVTREPGGTTLGERLRALLLDSKQALHPETEALLMFAARREHIHEIIEPALARGDWVLCDRFSDASYAYQAGGSGVPWEKIGALEAWVQGALEPDLTLYFDVSPELGRARAGAIKTPDRFEQEQGDFHARVRAAYLRRAQEAPRRIHVVDANGSVDDVSAAMREILLSFCKGS